MNIQQNHNRRSYERRAAYIIVEYKIAEGVFRDIIKSIGAHGVFINTRRQVQISQTIELRFPLFQFNDLVTISGKVVRTGPYGFAVQFDRPIEELVCEQGEFPEIVHEIDR